MAAVGIFPGQDPPPQISVSSNDDDGGMPVFDDSGAIIKIEYPDGSVTVSTDGKPLVEAQAAKKATEWFDNLANDIEATQLALLVDDLLRGIADDLESRREWIEDRATGIKLLALKVEVPGTQSAAEGAPVEGMSKVRHPLLLEAVLRSQANARSEMLPTDGPVKIHNDAQTDTLSKDSLATLLQGDMNHYLTTVAREYYPDTDRMLFMTCFGGTGFRKVYQCPLRNRPVLESVDADDLIVNNSATDLTTAQRITHRVMMTQSTVKRLQLLQVYRDVTLSDPMQPRTDALTEAKESQQGVTGTVQNPADREREIYECYCELNIPGFEHQWKGKPSGLPVPYRVTIDVSSREALAVVRNYNEPAEDQLPVARRVFVKWPYIPGLKFYDIGLLHILGNTTNALTAAWREMLDNGMFANFPGFLMADTAQRQNTNIFRVPPGGSASVKTGGMPIKDAMMPLPYETQHMAPLMQLTESMTEQGQRIGGTSEPQVGEGRADVPVGTVLAMIEQAVKVSNAVHKRFWTAQADELQLFRDCIRENVDDFIAANQRRVKGKSPPLDKAKLLAALDDYDLVPQADPNTSSNGQRIMKIQGVMQLSQASPNLYDPLKVHTAALNAMGWANPDEFFVPPAARGNPPPELVEMQAKMANEKAEAAAKTSDSQARMKEADAAVLKAKVDAATAGQVQPGEPPPPPTAIEQADAQAKLMDAETRRTEVGIKAREADIEDHNRDLDRQAKERDTALGLAKELIKTPVGVKDAEGALTRNHATPQNVGAKVNHIVDEIGKQP